MSYTGTVRRGGRSTDRGGQSLRTLGKRELLLWASGRSGLALRRLNDLRDGAAISALMALTFPDCEAAHSSAQSESPWEAVRSTARTLGLPQAGVDVRSMRMGSRDAMYNCLAMLHFLHCLASSHSHSAEYASALDPSLMAFLQSNAAVDALHRGGAVPSHLRLQPDEPQSASDTSPAPADPSGNGTEPRLPLGALSDEGCDEWNVPASPQDSDIAEYGSWRDDTNFSDSYSLIVAEPSESSGQISIQHHGIANTSGDEAHSHFREWQPRSDLSIDVSGVTSTTCSEAQRHDEQKYQGRKPLLKSESSKKDKKVTFAIAGAQENESKIEESQRDVQQLQAERQLESISPNEAPAMSETIELRFQNEGLRRVISAAREERELLINRYEKKLEAMQAQHDATIATHVETERNAATRRSLDIAYERAEDQKRYIMELQRLMTADSNEQAKARWNAAEERAASLEEERKGLCEQLDAERAHAAALRRRFGVEDAAEDGSISSHEELASQPRRREHELRAEVEDLKMLLKQKEASHAREVEEMRTQQGSSPDEQRRNDAFDVSMSKSMEHHGINEMKLQIKRLEASNRFLRKRLFGFVDASARQGFEQHETFDIEDSSGADDLASPTADLRRIREDNVENGEPLDSADRAAAEIYSVMQSGAAQKRAQKALWDIVASHAILSERVKVQEEQMSRSHQSERMISKEERNEHEKSNSHQRVAAELAERRADEAVEDARAAQKALVDARKENALTATQNFEGLAHTLQQSREEVAALRLREEHWSALLRAYKDTIELLESEHERLSLSAEEERAALEDKAMAECDALDDIKRRTKESELKDEQLDAAVKGARKELDEQLDAADKLRSELAEKTENAGALATQVRDLRWEVESERSAREEAEKRVREQEEKNSELMQRTEEAEAKLREQSSVLSSLYTLSNAV